MDKTATLSGGGDADCAAERMVGNSEVDFWFAREKEAAGAADVAAWVMLAVPIFGSDKSWVTRRCLPDPSTQNDAGGTPAPSLL